MNAQLVRSSFFEAQSRRPYNRNDMLVAAATPDGGKWDCVVNGDTRCIMFDGQKVATMQPGGIDRFGEIAMAARALPIMDAALRSIIVLSENPDNLALVRDLAMAVIAFVEEPAPRFKQAVEAEDEEGELTTAISMSKTTPY